MSHETPPDSDRTTSEFEKLAQEKQLSLLAEFRVFIVENKKWWLIPIIVVLGLMGLLIALGSTGAVPFIYTLF